LQEEQEEKPQEQDLAEFVHGFCHFLPGTAKKFAPTKKQSLPS
jgi:hypothetical protein